MTSPILTPRDWESHPPYCSSRLHVVRAAEPLAPADSAEGKPARPPRAGVRRRRPRRARPRPHEERREERRAARRAHHRDGPRARRRRPPRAQHARRNLAGERRRPLCAQERPARCAARPELPRRRPLRHRQRRPLSLPDDQAGRVSVGQPSERLASEPHPLFALRRLFRLAARHADVLPRRPAAQARPDLPGHSRACARAPDLALFHRYDGRKLRARLRIRHRAARPATKPRRRLEP